jgi:DNA polymerase IV
MESEIGDKVAYFDQLYALDSISDEEFPNTSFSRFEISTPSLNASFHLGTDFQESNSSANPALLRSASDPTPKSIGKAIIKDTPTHNYQMRLQHSRVTTSLAAEVSFVEETPSGSQSTRRLGSSPLRTVSAPMPPLLANPTFSTPQTSLGKRKRKEQALKLVPEAQQIFKKLTFFYVPPDDIAPIRRMRIKKAREHGVNWATIWTPNITHVVVDKNVSYLDILKFFKVDSLPSGVILVNEDYPIDCIQFKAILGPAQKQYIVTGYQEAPKTDVAQVPASQASDHSLLLKSSKSGPGRWKYNAKVTPSRSETSQSIIPETVKQVRNQSTESSPGIWLQVTSPTKDTTEDARSKSPEEISIGEPSRNYDDELEDLIKESRNVQHLPLDEDDEDRPSSRDSLQDSDDSADENLPLPKKHATGSKAKGGHWQEKFNCMTGGTGNDDSGNPNARTIAILQEMADYYTRMDDTWRPIAYRKAITTLRQQSILINTAKEAQALPGIGQRLATKIEEIVLTHRLRRLDNTKLEPTDQILQLFLRIYGVGLSQATAWLSQGYRSIEDLLEKATLSDNQRVGIAHYDDFQTRIPRAEVNALASTIRAVATLIDPAVSVIIGGSYRRGASSCGDIDCLVTKPGTRASSELMPFLHRLTSRLTEMDFFVAALAVPRSTESTKWHGCCVLPSAAEQIWRRIDFLLAPASELGAALIYFTGNDIFNRSLRLLASRKGMRLNQRGLYSDVLRGPGRVKLNDGELVEGADERRIFEVLGVPWRPPEQRIC